MNNGAHLKPLPPIVDAAEFTAKILTPPPQLVHGILHRESKLVLGGGSKSFKTFCLLDLGLSVAYGVPWLNFDTTEGRVLYCNFEIPDWSWQKRIQDVASAKRIKIEPNRFAVWNLRGHAADYRTLLPRIREAVAREYAMIILDPAYKLYGSTDENKAGDIAALLNAIEALGVDSGSSTAFGHHFSKGNQSAKESIDRISGSGVFARDPDSLLIFTRHEEDDCFTIESTLRNFAPVDPFVVRWEHPLMRLADDLDPAKLRERAGRKQDHQPEELLAVIADHGPDNPIAVSAWAKLAGVKRTTLANYVGDMRLRGWVRTSGEDTQARQFITPEGLQFLRGRTHSTCQK